MKMLFDTNVILDVLLARRPYVESAARLFALADRGRITGVICATTVTTIHYLAEKAVGRAKARKHLRNLLAIFDVACVDREVLERAMQLQFADFEDAVLHEAALAHGAIGIVTRNGKDFAAASLPIFDPGELLAAIMATNPKA